MTTTLNSTFSFNTLPGLVQVPVSLHNATTVHEVHGNITLAVWQAAGSCGNGSIIAELRDQNVNVIAAVKLQQWGQAAINVPISGTFSVPLSVTSLQLQLYVDLCGPQTVTLGLVMN